MRSLAEFRTGKPGSYPDQSIYAEFACAELGLRFRDLDGGSGMVFGVEARDRSLHFGAGRCSWFPQNNATASTLASDKYFAARILRDAGVPALGGEYFFLHERHRAHRPAGHERSDAIACFRALSEAAFIKPLTGSRGDFAQAVHGEAALDRYLDEVTKHYDAILIQPIVEGSEYRVFLLDGAPLYVARKHLPFVTGDGSRNLRELLRGHNAALRARGLSPASLPDRDSSLDAIPAKGERREIPGRMNLSAGGRMELAEAPSGEVVILAQKAARALGLRVAAIDMFVDVGSDPGRVEVIEVNSNPSIRLLEDSGRDDLILKIWRHTFTATGLL